MTSSQRPLYYYLNERQEPVGPVTLETIGALVSSGRLPATVFVARAGDAEWVPYSAWCAAASAPSATPAPRQARPGARMSRAGASPLSLSALPVTSIAPCTMPKPATNMVWAILVTFCCCSPLGIVAIIKAASVDSHYYAGRYLEAVKASRSAANWCGWSVILVLLPYVIIIYLVAFNQ